MRTTWFVAAPFFDAEDRLTNRRQAASIVTESNIVTAYSFDPVGNLTNYVYDGRLVVQERHYTRNGGSLIPLTAVTYTRGNDLSGSLDGAGGIGGLFARSEISNSQSPHAYYRADANGNITALIGTNGIAVARYSYDPYGNILAMGARQDYMRALKALNAALEEELRCLQRGGP